MQTGGVGVAERSGRYTIHAEIAAGGMARVHLGRFSGPHGFSRTVAIKELHESFARDESFVARFIDEARLVARISHPNVMPTLDVIARGGQLSIVMDYVTGESLGRLEDAARARGERLPARIACAIVVGMLHGLHAAHEAKNEFGEPLGIVHLDVSPDNVLVGIDGVPRVLDFGVARAKGKGVPGEVAGKIAYMAPEQLRALEVTPRTDVFAAAIVLWEALAGEHPFATDNAATTMQRVLSGPIPALTDRVTDVGPALAAVVERGLQRDPAARFATARDMALALESALPPALPSEVGRWVEDVARDTLGARATLVHEMESASARRGQQIAGLVAPREMYAELAEANRSEDDDFERADTAALLRPPAPGMVPERAKDGSVSWKKRGAPPPAAPPRPSPPHASPSDAPPPVPSRPRDGAARVALGQEPLTTVDTARRPRAASRGGVRHVGPLVVSVLACVAVLGAVFRSVAVPAYVRNAAIAEAAAEGIHLTVQDARLDAGAVVMTGMKAALDGVPQVTIAIATATAQLSWLRPVQVTLSGVEIGITGDARTVVPLLKGWMVSRGRRPAGPGMRHAEIDLPAVHVVWTEPYLPSVTRFEASSLQGSISSPNGALRQGEELHLLTPELTLSTPSGRVGPWSVDLDASSSGTRARLAFDPVVPDGPNAILLSDAQAGTTFDISIPRLAPSRLGIPPPVLGAHATADQVEMHLHYEAPLTGQEQATLKAAAYGTRVESFGESVDVGVTGEAAGTQGSLVVKSGTAYIGPFHATLGGTVTLLDGRLKLYIPWKGDPIPCANLLPPPETALRDLGAKASASTLDLRSLARDVGALAHATGALRITGTLAASGVVKLDTDDLAHPSFSFDAKNGCGLELFRAR